MRYEKYRIGQLFTSQTGNVDIQKNDITSTGVPVITAGVNNNGILGNTEIEAKIIKANTITIDMFGNAFFRPFEYKMVTHARVFSLTFIKEDISEEIGLFLTAQFCHLSKKYGFDNMCSYAKIKDSTITLPTLDKIDDNSPYSEQGFIPDFDYMQKYIEELIVDYLKVIEFNDNYGPINEEPMIRQNHQKVKKFKVGDLFEIKNGKDCHPQQHETDELNGIPMVCASRFNNGIGTMLKRDNKMKIFEAGQLTWGKQCPCFFYQEEEFTTGQGIYMLDTRSISKEAALFVASILDKVVAPNYDYGNCLIGEKLANEVIELPVTAEGTPDWDYMEQYIKVIEKVMIQNMIEYKNDQLKYYKQLIKEENHE